MIPILIKDPTKKSKIEKTEARAEQKQDGLLAITKDLELPRNLKNTLQERITESILRLDRNISKYFIRGGEYLNTWEMQNWKECKNQKTGLYIRFEKKIDPEVRRALLELTRWLRSRYTFPSKVIVYVYASKYVHAKDGEPVFGTCWRPGDRSAYSHIKLSTGDYPQLLEKYGKDNALASILNCELKMLTHYFQWANNLDDLTEKEECYDASKCAKTILKQYSQTRDHP